MHSNNLSVVYIGTPDFSARLLDFLIKNKEKLKIEIPFVITQEDKPFGRTRELKPSPVKVLACQNDIPVKYNLSEIKTLDKKNTLVILYAYGKIIPKSIIDHTEYGFWNIHPSILPKYRGASPISFPLTLGDKNTGVTLMQMDEFLDHGNIIDQICFDIKIEDTQKDIQQKATDIANKIIEKNLSLLRNGNVIKKQQIHENATFTRILTKDDGYIKSSLIKKAINNEFVSYSDFPNLLKWYNEKNNIIGCEKCFAMDILYNMHRGLYEWPGVWTTLTLKDNSKKRLKIVDISILENGSKAISSVQIEGKNPVDFETFVKYYEI